MTAVNSLVTTLGGLPLASLLLLVALGAMGLAAFAIHAVVSVVKPERTPK
jgi:hypothetical protein